MERCASDHTHTHTHVHVRQLAVRHDNLHCSQFITLQSPMNNELIKRRTVLAACTHAGHLTTDTSDSPPRREGGLQGARTERDHAFSGGLSPCPAVKHHLWTHRSPLASAS